MEKEKEEEKEDERQEGASGSAGVLEQGTIGRQTELRERRKNSPLGVGGGGGTQNEW